MHPHPTPWQRKTLWTALTALAVAFLVSLTAAVLWLVGKVTGFLQPLLLPVAVAAIMAFLLEPVVRWLNRAGLSRRKSVLTVFAFVTLLTTLLLVWLVPALYVQSIRFGSKLPGYTMMARERVVKFVSDHASGFAPFFSTRSHASGVAGTPPEAQPVNTSEPPPLVSGGLSGEPETPAAGTAATISNPLVREANAWLHEQLPNVTARAWRITQNSIGGFLGVFGFLFSMVVVPLYLFYFLIEGQSISRDWSKYVPLRTSHFKDEVVASINEINHYLIAFFRGQLLVSMINGVATGIGLLVVGLDFGLVIGLLLCMLGIIPYLGITLCWVPAVIIATVQSGSWLVPESPWWVFPLVVTGIFVVVQQVDGLFVTPRIIGSSVGLHPVTVILSVFGWGLLLGGLLGALLAVPLTATLKVILRRYVWERRTSPPSPDAPPPPEAE